MNRYQITCNRLWAATTAAVVTWLASSAAVANTGVPMIGFIWPGGWLLFPLVVLIEGLVARRMLHLDYRTALVLSAKANAWSTFIGIPIAWVSWLLLGYLAQGVFGGVPQWTFLFWGAAFPPGRPHRPWLLFASAAVLCVPAFFASVFIERRVAGRALPGLRVDAWSWWANSLTYAVIIVGLAVTAWVAHP